MKTHVIHWRCRISGKTGIGAILLEPEEADFMAKELNEEFPDIQHEAQLAEKATLRSVAIAE
jgi:hypothetical protein